MDPKAAAVFAKAGEWEDFLRKSLVSPADFKRNMKPLYEQLVSIDYFSIITFKF